jgi:outer membrane murein-binding lipoprotein Lpp
MTTAKLLAAAAVVAATMLACCSSSPSPTADLVREPAGKISVDGMPTHLGKLQEIADAKAHPRGRHARIRAWTMSL